MKKYKGSHYNLLVPVPEEREFLLYNTFSGGLEVLPEHEGTAVARFIAGEEFIMDYAGEGRETLQYLHEKGYIVEAEVDERQLFQAYNSKKSAARDTPQVGDIGLTIGTTIVCNMGCPYCFEFIKPNKYLKDEAIDGIIYYLESMMEKAPVKQWRNMEVIWYGGEPLVNKRAIEKLAPRLRDFSNKYGLNFNARIITNGILLTPEAWQLLKNAGVGHAQVTIDGAKEVHDQYRPLKSKNGKNYELILENLSNIPDGMTTTIRVNVDRRVADSLPRFMADLKQYGLWPQKHKSINIELAWLRTYEEAGEQDTSTRLTNPQFFDVQQEFRKMKLRLFNEWARQNNRPAGKLKWQLPTAQEDCATWVSPYHVVVAPEGDIHKCWETIHGTSGEVKHVSQGFDLKDFEGHAAFNRSDLNPTCYNCRFLPVCDGLSCSHHALMEEHLPCTYWKSRLDVALKDQYLLMKSNPEEMAAPVINIRANTGHANK